jgi:tripartite ATP-independent transporter DctM subunit
MSIELLALVVVAAMLLLLVLGMPIAFVLGGISAIVAVTLWGPDHLYILASAAFSQLQDLNLAAIPLFVLMAWVFQRSGIAEDVFTAINLWFGRIPGGLAIGVIIVATVFAAIIGELVAAIFTITTIALPSMLDRGYDPALTIGCIMAGALLGLIIPPSIEVIVYASVTGVSVGRMYLGTLVPGLLLSSLYILYIVVRCRLSPEIAPPVQDERAGLDENLAAFKGILAPLVLILVIIGGIYSGAITPLEASAVGATGALIIAMLRGKLSLELVRRSMMQTLNVSTMIAWLLIAIGTFSTVINGLGATDLGAAIAGAVPGERWGAVILTQLALIGFGMYLDDFAVIMIFGPIFQSTVTSLGFDGLWYGVLFMINMQLAFLTPPYGFALFCMRAAIPPQYGIGMGTIYIAAFPFILIQLLCLALVMVFPSLATWLPSVVIK